MICVQFAKDPYEYKEAIPARALYNPVAVGVFCKGITLDYLVCDNWRFRIDNSWNCREQTVLLKRNSVHLAHVFQLYLGGGGYFAKKSWGYVVGSDFIRHFFVECNWKGREKNWKYGLRLHY